MRALFFAGAAAALSAPAIAGGINVTYRDTLSIPFNVGTGNSNTNFAISRDSESEVELGLKAKERFVGDANVGGSLNTYIVQTGYSPTSGSNPTLDPPNAWWNFDLSIDLGASTFDDVDVHLGVFTDFNFASMDIDISSYLQGLGAGGLSVAQDSLNLAFSAFAPLGFDATQTGSYYIRLYAFVPLPFDGSPVHEVGDVTIRVQVDGPTVPLPTGAALGLAGLAGLTTLRRRR